MSDLRRRDKYKKTPLKLKVLFLKRVLEDGESIKKVLREITQVSAEYRINYSTAKTLIRNEKLNKSKLCLGDLEVDISSTHKGLNNLTTSSPRAECGYRPILS